MALNPKLLLPVALGLSLVTVSAFVVYYLLRKDDEDEETNNKSQIKTSRLNIIEVSVPKNLVPALIGRGGSNIKEIERKTGASIKFKKFPDRSADTCIIQGRAETTQLAETLIHEFIGNQPLIEEDKIQVPSWACGRIIGMCGDNINEICHRSGARVKVEGGPAGDDTNQRVVSFRGTKQQIKLARDLVERSVAQQKCLREVESSKSPRHSHPANDGAQSGDVPGDNTSIPKHAKSSPRAGGVAGASIEVYVSAVSSPSRFWVQFVGAQVTQLDALVEHMTDYYSNADNRQLHALSQVSVGQVVAAVFRHDGRWYRARVVDIRQNEFASEQRVADVFFLDYGDSEYVATHELCELRSDLLRLRFQAMECFLAGVRPAGPEEEAYGVTESGQRWDKWNPKAIQRFEELAQVARWKSLVSKTCTYKKSIYLTGNESERDKEIPGIKLYDVSDEGEVDIGAVLMEEGWAVEVPLTPRPSPRSAASSPSLSTAPATPFGDLGASRVLGMLSDHGERASSLPRDPSPSPGPHQRTPHGDDRMSSMGSDTAKPISTSLSSGLEKNETTKRAKSPLTTTHADLSYPNPINGSPTLTSKPRINGSHTDFLNVEREDLNSSTEAVEHTPMHIADPRDEFKANMNRIDSHHGNLEALGGDTHK